MKRSNLINIAIVVLVIIIAAIILMNGKNNPKTDEETSKCIGSKSTLYVQLGCVHCKTQEEMFGDFKKELNIIDCFYERDKCSEIKATPTWDINGKFYEGVQSIETLKELTGC